MTKSQDVISESVYGIERKIINEFKLLHCGKPKNCSYWPNIIEKYGRHDAAESIYTWDIFFNACKLGGLIIWMQH